MWVGVIPFPSPLHPLFIPSSLSLPSLLSLPSHSLVAPSLPPSQPTPLTPRQLPDGSFINDSSEIIATIDELFPKDTVTPPLASRPRQRLAAKV